MKSLATESAVKEISANVDLALRMESIDRRVRFTGWKLAMMRRSHVRCNDPPPNWSPYESKRLILCALRRPQSSRGNRFCTDVPCEMIVIDRGSEHVTLSTWLNERRDGVLPLFHDNVIQHKIITIARLHKLIRYRLPHFPWRQLVLWRKETSVSRWEKLLDPLSQGIQWQNFFFSQSREKRVWCSEIATLITTLNYDFFQRCLNVQR